MLPLLPRATGHVQAHCHLQFLQLVAGARRLCHCCDPGHRQGSRAVEAHNAVQTQTAPAGGKRAAARALPRIPAVTGLFIAWGQPVYLYVGPYGHAQAESLRDTAQHRRAGRGHATRRFQPVEDEGQLPHPFPRPPLARRSHSAEADAPVRPAKPGWPLPPAVHIRTRRACPFCPGVSTPGALACAVQIARTRYQVRYDGCGH